MIDTNSQKIEEILSRGVEDVFERKSLLEKLRSGKQLRIKHGIDPTGPKIHIGRALQFWKLRDFQELGHKIVLIIGDFTAQIGDASDKDSMRKILTEREVKKNMASYVQQIGKILDMKKVELLYNSKWFSKMKIRDFISLQMLFTAQQTIQRRNFKDRWEASKPIGLHELDYPLLQGYDSVMVNSDVETGGSDQLFNLQVGREIQKEFKQKLQDILILKMLSGLDGRKMSTSWGNLITIVDEPKDMYGKVMSIKDELMDEYFELATRLSKKEIDDIKKSSDNPRDAKADLAREIVRMYHGEKSAQLAQNNFDKVFRQKKLPASMPIFKTSKNSYPVLDLLFDAKVTLSKNEAKRLVQGGAVTIEINGKKVKIDDWKKIINIKNGMVIKTGKRFIKIKIK
ncbi:MAG: tyrosine--tRNA ligase [Candidatus Staskawiczbacteria bacterium]|nr:tyrosine--tRNA ligase [Candidatus Staskawiczbacteria bacterium]